MAATMERLFPNMGRKYTLVNPLWDLLACIGGLFAIKALFFCILQALRKSGARREWIFSEAYC